MSDTAGCCCGPPFCWPKCVESSNLECVGISSKHLVSMGDNLRDPRNKRGAVRYSLPRCARRGYVLLTHVSPFILTYSIAHAKCCGPGGESRRGIGGITGSQADSDGRTRLRAQGFPAPQAGFSCHPHGLISVGNNSSP